MDVISDNGKCPEICVLVPAYNEERFIPELVAALTGMFDSEGLDGEIVLVDDGSTDSTFQKSQEEAAREQRLRVIRHRANFGKTEAMVTGNAYVRAPVVVLYDADMQHRVEEIPRFLKKINEGFDIVCGRKVGDYKKRFVSGIYNSLSRRLFEVPARDLNSMKAYRKEILDELHLRHDWHRFFVVLAYDRGYKVGEIDIELLPRKYGESKYTGFGRVIIGLLDLLSVKFQVSLTRKPMTIYGSWGMVMMVLGFLTGLVALYLRFFLYHGYRPLLTLVLLFMLGGVLLFILGFLAESLGQLFERLERIEKKMENNSGKYEE